jgi:hypothetical protein
MFSIQQVTLSCQVLLTYKGEKFIKLKMNLLTFTEARGNEQLMKVLTSKKVDKSPIFHEDRNFGI